MTQSKKRYWLLFAGLLLLLTVIPRDNAKADVAVPPAHPGPSLSPGDFETNVQMVSEEVEIIIKEDPFEASAAASVSPTPPVPSATQPPADPTQPDGEIEAQSAAPPLSSPPIMGISFIAVAVVLIIIAVKRGEN